MTHWTIPSCLRSSDTMLLSSEEQYQETTAYSPWTARGLPEDVLEPWAVQGGRCTGLSCSPLPVTIQGLINQFETHFLSLDKSKRTENYTSSLSSFSSSSLCSSEFPCVAHHPPS